ncbi:MAG TPA: glucan 1,4-alpha-glucosidase [Pyrinomonadaceae bacterium]|nr:glucan 1,4-alpha-glucosidase [Pyrinomonadaceae bacterium]
MKRKLSALPMLLACSMLLASASSPRAQTVGNNLAPGAPGRDARWESAGKTAVGTSNTLESKVWFTLRAGVMTEVYYPTVDVGNTRVLEFAVTPCASGDKALLTESEDTTHRLEVLDEHALSFRQVNKSKDDVFTIIKTYTVDPERSTILVNVEFQSGCRGVQELFVYYDPSLNNSGMHDSAWTEGDALLASDADKASALVVGGGIGDATNGYFGTSDGLTQMRRRPARPERYARAADGNVVQFASVRQPTRPFTVALGFGREPDEALKNARASLAKGFARARAEYEEGWHEYVKTLRRVEPKYQRQFDMAAMVLKAHEDKTFRGAMIASLSVPWGGGASANEPNVGGYHLVWARDLYQVATAFHALGDKASADRALDYLFRVQQKPDGSFPQNSWLDGRPFWGSLQLDEVAYPLVLAYQLGRTDNETWTKHIRPAADFIVQRGPYTPQERWEEESGYSPSTIAAEIAGLVCAAEIARRNGDEASAHVYRAAADDWTRRVEAWTATTTGPHGDKNYYLRITENEDPNDGEPRELNNGAGTFDERQIVDAGFLELVRLGVKSPRDPLISKSLAVIDQLIKVETPNGASFYRYNHDGYGEMDDGRPWNWDGKYTGKGRLWALLAGERGQYELARGEREAAARRLEAMQDFANEGLMIPEQVWDLPQSPAPDLKFGEGTGSATPLAWSMAQFIRLAANLQEGRNLDTPDLVAARYVSKPPPAQSSSDFNVPAEAVLSRMEAGQTFRVRGRVPPKSRAFALYNEERRELQTDARGAYEFDVEVVRGESSVLVGTLTPTGATSFHRARVRGLTAEEKRKAELEDLNPKLMERVKTATRSPLVEGEEVTFIYRGAAKRVEVVGDFTGWGLKSHVLREAPGAGAKSYTLRFPKGSRVEYKLIADGEWMLDPLNPDRNDNGVGGENSFFTTPGYSPPAYVLGRAGNALPQVVDLKDAGAGGPAQLKTIPQTLLTIARRQANDAASKSGLVVLDELDSRVLGGKRKISIYLPSVYLREERDRYPVLYVQDGTEYLRRASAVAAAEHLVSTRRLKPFVIVFVDPLDRMKEYWADDRFADFMAQELVPYIDSRYRTHAARDRRALLGASLGGVISVWTALRHPEVFARVGGQSTAFWIDDERVVTALSALDEAARRKHPLRFYFDTGRLESALDANRRVRVMLAAKGYPVTYRETEAGHNYTTWRDRLADAFTALWSD